MSPEDFVSELVSRFSMAETIRDKDSGRLGTRIMVKHKILVSDYRDFARKYPKLLSQVIESVKDEYVYPYPPKKATLTTYVAAAIEDQKIQKKEEEYHANQSQIVQCQRCSALYDKQSLVCPKCLCHERTAVTSPDDLKYIHVQTDCYRCLYFRDKPPEGQKVFGPKCKHFGDLPAGKRDGAATGKNPCDLCACKDCCEMEWLFQTDPRSYKKKYGKGSPIYQPETYTPVWIDPEVPILGEHFVEDNS